MALAGLGTDSYCPSLGLDSAGHSYPTTGSGGSHTPLVPLSALQASAFGYRLIALSTALDLAR